MKASQAEVDAYSMSRVPNSVTFTYCSLIILTATMPEAVQRIGDAVPRRLAPDLHMEHRLYLGIVVERTERQLVGAWILIKPTQNR